MYARQKLYEAVLSLIGARPKRHALTAFAPFAKIGI